MCCLAVSAEDQVDSMENDHFSKDASQSQSSSAFVDGGTSHQSNHVIPDEGQDAEENREAGDATSVVPQTDVSGEGNGDAQQSRESEAPTTLDGSDTAGQTAGTSQSQHSGMPVDSNVDEAGNPPNEQADLQAEGDCSGTPKSLS